MIIDDYLEKFQQQGKAQGFILNSSVHIAQGFKAVKKVGDVECGIKAMAFTWALMVKLNITDLLDAECERRYCYSNPVDAFEALIKYEDTRNHPSGPWIKCKGRMNGEHVDLLNPAWSKS